MRVGFGSNEPFQPRMEEEADFSGFSSKRGVAVGEDDEGASHEGAGGAHTAQSRLLLALAEERETILGNEKFSAKEIEKLLESNRRTIVIASGGHILGTEKVVFGLLAFSALVVAFLASLTTFSDLPSEVTLTFVGTVMGGLLATVAQKIGRI
jgi:hypothetical protein